MPKKAKTAAKKIRPRNIAPKIHAAKKQPEKNPRKKNEKKEKKTAATHTRKKVSERAGGFTLGGFLQNTIFGAPHPTPQIKLADKSLKPAVTPAPKPALGVAKKTAPLPAKPASEKKKKEKADNARREKIEKAQKEKAEKEKAQQAAKEKKGKPAPATFKPIQFVLPKTKPEPVERTVRPEPAPVAAGEERIPFLSLSQAGQQAQPEAIVSRKVLPPAVVVARRILVAPTKVGKGKKGRLAERVSSGVPGLDALIEKGFERESVVLVTGDPGSGKTTLGLQYLINGAKAGENGILITFEERSEDLFKHAARYGWDLEGLVNDKKIVIFEYAPHEIEQFVEQGGLLRDTVDDIEARRLVIDSASSIALLFDNEYKMRLSLIKLAESLKKWGLTSLLVSEGTMDARGEPHDRFGLEYLADGILYLYNQREGEGRKRELEIIELKGTKHSLTLHDLEFGHHGLEVKPDHAHQKSRE